MIYCFNYSKLEINTLSILITISIFLIIEIFNNLIVVEINITPVRKNPREVVLFEEFKIKNKLSDEWKIEIPKINLVAEISEGTTEEVLDYFVGHFENTSKDFGNIGLASHNRGYKVNYFENIKKLEVGDEVYYYYQGLKKTFEVCNKDIIEETDWSMLENTKENKITLITCVENMPKYRRCIQAIEREEFNEK